MGIRCNNTWRYSGVLVALVVVFLYGGQPGARAGANRAGETARARSREAPAVSVTRWAGPDRFATAARVSAAAFPDGAPLVFIATGVDFPDALAAGAVGAIRHAPVLLTWPDLLPSVTARELERLRPETIVVLGGSAAVSEAVALRLATYASVEVQRWSGADRYATAAAVSAAVFVERADTVLVANGARHPDALSAGSVAGRLDAPLLLTTRDRLPRATMTELERLEPAEIVVLGGPAAVSEAVVTELETVTGGIVTRWAGTDRFATAAAASAAAFPEGALTVLVATGSAFPDGIAGAPAGGVLRAPVLLSGPTALPAATLAELRRLRPARVLVLGGAAAVAPTVVAELRGLPAPQPPADPPSGTTSRVSVSSSGRQGNDSSTDVWLSADGRFVAFGSRASNLVAGDTNGSSDAFVHDRSNGVTRRVNVATSGAQADSGIFAPPSISGDGRHVAFGSEAANLVPNDTNGDHDVFVRDRATAMTTRVSVTPDGRQANSGSAFARLSADGRFLAFSSLASNLVPGQKGGLFVRDQRTGSLERVDVGWDGAPDDLGGAQPSISGDGRIVAFQSLSAALVPDDTNDEADLFVRDRLRRTTRRVNVSSAGGQADGHSEVPAVSGDGRYVAFTAGPNLVRGGGENGHVYVHDRHTQTTRRVSVASDGTPSNNWSGNASISHDGRYVAFASDASNLTPDDDNGHTDVFVHDRRTGATWRVSVSTVGAQANERSNNPVISADGRSVVFSSIASNLVPGDTNDTDDVFVHQLRP